MSLQTTSLESLQEPAPIALVGTDREGRIRFVNQQVESLFGYGREHLVGEPIQTLVPEVLWQVYVEHKDDYFADPRTWSMGLELDVAGRRRDGEEFPIRVSLSHIDTEELLLGITESRASAERKQALENAQRMTAIINGSDDAIIGKTPEGRVTSWNPAAERMYGYSSREMIGRSINVLIPADRPTEMNDILTKIRRGQHVEHFETNRVRKDGTAITVSLSISPIRNENREIVGATTIARDLTDQRQAYEALQRVEAIVRDSVDAIVSATMDRIITSWNPAAEKMFGYSGEEIIGKDGGILSPKGSASQASAIVAKVLAGQHPDHFETTRVRKDGTKITVWERVSPIRDRNGELTGVSAIFRHVGEDRRTFEAARAMIESSLDSMVAIDPEGRITDVNQATVKVTGLARQELIGTDFSQCFTDPMKADQIYQQVVAEGMAAHFPLIIRHRDGALTEVLYNASVYRDDDGAVLGVFAAARDVSQVRAAFESARSMIESSLDALVAISPEGTITDANQATVKITGVPRDEMIGASFSECFTEPERAEEIYQKVFADGMAVDYPLTMRHRDGTLTEVLYNASVYRDPRGKVLGVFAAARDVTEQTRAQKVIAEQRAKELNRLAELEMIHQRFVGRELKMIELKKEIENLGGTVVD